MGMRILEQEVMMSEEEVMAYDRLVHQYLQILHVGFIETVINLSPVSGSFLDVGTGTGWIAVGVAKHNSGVEVTGVDLSDEMLNVARKNAASEGVGNRTKFQRGDAKGLPFGDGSFDAVFCHNMLHHLPEPLSLVREMRRVAKKDGSIIIRDLVRHSRLVTELHVNLFGFQYNQLMKKEYRDSILASLSRVEWAELCAKSGINGALITRQFVTHQGIEKASTRRRTDYVSLDVPFLIRPLKSLYVSRP